MQAQASGDKQGILQKPAVLIGVAIAGAIAIIAVIIQIVASNGGGTPPEPYVANGTGNGTDANGTSAAVITPGAADANAPGTTPGGSFAAPAGVAPGAAGAAAPGAGAPGAPGAAADAPRTSAPLRPAGANPFKPNNEIRRVIANAALNNLPKPVPPDLTIPGPQENLYFELSPPKPASPVEQGEGLAGPPIPAMRVSAIVRGDQITALLQIGEQFVQVTPGIMVPKNNPVYRVERIENERVILVRRWTEGTRKGVQRIEVTLQGAAQQAGGGTFTPSPGPGGPAPNFGGGDTGLGGPQPF